MEYSKQQIGLRGGQPIPFQMARRSWSISESCSSLLRRVQSYKGSANHIKSLHVSRFWNVTEIRPTMQISTHLSFSCIYNDI